MTIFLEGDHVDYVGDGLDGIPPARGKIAAFANDYAAHVVWEDGPRVKQMDIVHVRDLEKSTSTASMAAGRPLITPIAVRLAMQSEGETGVLRYLAATSQLSTWERIGREVLGYVEGRLKIDSSMDQPYEQLSFEEAHRVVEAAARTLLRDMFSGSEE